MAPSKSAAPRVADHMSYRGIYRVLARQTRRSIVDVPLDHYRACLRASGSWDAVYLAARQAAAAAPPAPRAERGALQA